MAHIEIMPRFTRPKWKAQWNPFQSERSTPDRQRRILTSTDPKPSVSVYPWKVNKTIEKVGGQGGCLGSSLRLREGIHFNTGRWFKDPLEGGRGDRYEPRTLKCPWGLNICVTGNYLAVNSKIWARQSVDIKRAVWKPEQLTYMFK